jgi:excisionase family DNA binding protein
VSLHFEVPEEWLAAIAERVAEILLTRQAEGPGRRLVAALARRGEGAGPYLSVREAADYMRCSSQRVYDLLSARRQTRHRDGRRVLLLRGELDDYLAAKGSSRVAPALPHASQRRIGSGFRG